MKYSLVFLDDGLSPDEAKKRYRARRETLLKAAGAPVLLMGVQKEQNDPFNWLLTHIPLFQEPTFHFYTGLNQTKCAVLLCPTGDDVLFLPKKDEHKIFWEGAHLGSGSTEAEEETRGVTGFEKIENISHLESYIKDVECVSEKDVSRLQLEQRILLDSVDQENLLEANKRTSDAIVATMKEVSKLSSEQEVSGRLLGELSMRTSKGISFPAIVAGGKNAAILHYNKNDEPLDPNVLILIDCGLRYHSMPADISRTIPRNGRFNPLQRCVYNIVLRAQLKVEKKIKAGVTLQELNDICWGSIEADLETEIVSKGGTINRPYERAPHGVGHLIGLMVHDGDSQRNYKDDPLKPGMVISNEPGLYGEFALTIDGVTYTEHLGIRIEDDILVTETGSINLTLCPKTCEDIETIMGSK